jgi:hypothetical protein
MEGQIPYSPQSISGKFREKDFKVEYESNFSDEKPS